MSRVESPRAYISTASSSRAWVRCASCSRIRERYGSIRLGLRTPPRPRRSSSAPSAYRCDSPDPDHRLSRSTPAPRHRRLRPRALLPRSSASRASSPRILPRHREDHEATPEAFDWFAPMRVLSLTRDASSPSPARRRLGFRVWFTREVASPSYFPASLRLHP